MGPSAPDSPVGLTGALDEGDRLVLGGGGALVCWTALSFLTAGVALAAVARAGAT